MPLDCKELTADQVNLYNRMHAVFGMRDFSRKEASIKMGISYRDMIAATNALQERGMLYPVRFGVYSFLAPAHVTALKNLNKPASLPEGEPLPHLTAAVHRSVKHYSHVVRAEEKRAKRDLDIASLKTHIPEPTEARRRAGR